MTTIYPDGEILPFAITFTEDSYWADKDGAKVESYPAETPVLEFHGKSLKYYKDLDLVYKFVDDGGNVLYENTLKVTSMTDTFVFTWDREGLDPLFAPVEETEETETQTTTEPATGIRIKSGHAKTHPFPDFKVKLKVK